MVSELVSTPPQHPFGAQPPVHHGYRGAEGDGDASGNSLVMWKHLGLSRNMLRPDSALVRLGPYEGGTSLTA